jgi:DNA-binding MarR family transcriptional regulator
VPNEPGPPDGDLPHALTRELFDLSLAIDAIGQVSATRLGINHTDLMCLDLLTRRGPMSAGEIAAALGMTTAAISAMATRLEAGGYAHRHMDPNDRRRVLLHPSPEGTRTAFSLFDDLYHASTELNTHYDTTEQRLLVDLLRTYRQLISDHTIRLRNDPATPRSP